MWSVLKALCESSVLPLPTCKTVHRSQITDHEHDHFYLHAVEQCVKLGRNISCFSQAPNSQAVDHTFCCCCCLVSPDKHFGGHQVYVTVFIATLHYMQLCFDKCISQGVRIACVTSCLFSFICVLLLLFCFVLNYPAIQAAACLLRRLYFHFLRVDAVIYVVVN